MIPYSQRTDAEVRATWRRHLDAAERGTDESFDAGMNEDEPDPEDAIEAARVQAWPALMALGAHIETIAAVDAAGRME